MESTGVPGRIQMTQATARLLIQADKQAWVENREGMVQVKGKGSLQVGGQIRTEVFLSSQTQSAFPDMLVEI